MIVVTGATGTVGEEVVRGLAEKGVAVRAAVRSASKTEDLVDPHVEILPFDFDRSESVDAALSGAEKIFLATPLSPEQEERGIRLVDAAVRGGVRHIVRLSAMGAEDEPGTLSGRSHRGVERRLQESGIAWTILRPNLFMQNFVTIHGTAIKKDGRLHLPQGLSPISFVDVRDIAAVAVEALLRPGLEGRVLELTGPEAITNLEAVEILSRLIDKRLGYVDVPEATARQEMSEAGAPAWLVDAMMQQNAWIRRGRHSHVTTTVEEILGRKAGNFHRFAQDYSDTFLGGS